MALGLVVILLALLYGTNIVMVNRFAKLTRKFGGGNKLTIYSWSLFFLPGTIIHEVSHLLAAALTHTRSGKITIFPEYLEESTKQTSVRLGSVQVAPTNPLQSFFIGIAPLVSGLLLIYFLGNQIQIYYSSRSYFQVAILGYLFFTISNSLFPSWADIKQTLPLVFILLLLFISLLAFGIYSLDNLLKITNPLVNLVPSLTISILINGFVSLFMYII